MKNLLLAFVALCFFTAGTSSLFAAAPGGLNIGMTPSGGSDLTDVSASAPGLRMTASPMKTSLFKKKPKRWFAVGAVFGDPTGFGGRLLIQPWRIGAVIDVGMGSLRLDNGQLVGATTVKIDGRWYGKGIGNFIRPYMFGGLTTTMANFGEFDKQLFQIDAGIGGELRIWRLGINGEVGLIAPVEQVQNFTAKPGVFGNVGVMLFLF